MCRPTKRSKPAEHSLCQPNFFPTEEVPSLPSFDEQQPSFDFFFDAKAVSSPDSDFSFSEDKPKTFVYVLFDMLSNANNKEVVCFTQQGNGLEVRDSSLLAEKILPQYFRHKNVASFYRQLNSYGFRTVRAAPAHVEHLFVHDLFHRDFPQRLGSIVRKKHQQQQQQQVQTIKEDEQSEVRKMIEELKALQEEQIRRAQALEEHNQRIEKENQAILLEGEQAFQLMENMVKTQTNAIEKLFGAEASKSFAAQAQPELNNLPPMLMKKEPKLEDAASLSDEELLMPDQDLLDMETLITFDELLGC